MTIGLCVPWVPLPKYIVAIPQTWGCPRDAGGECLSAKMSRQLRDVDGAPARKEVVAAWTWGCRRRGSHVAQRLHAPARKEVAAATQLSASTTYALADRTT
jgi:hypothetical protein